MKKVILGFVATSALFLTGVQAQASELMVAAAMQRCTSNEECALVTNSCADNCGFVPVNKLNLATLQQTYQARCGKPMESNPQCNINPPISAACINSRCTIDYAYKNNADAKDYKAGAYPVPEAAVPDKVPASDAPANDRQGFTAYQLPNTEVRQDSMGEITTKIYVPPQAPVNGGNYVPVNQQGAAPQPQPVAIAPAPAPAAAPYAAPAPVPAPAAAMPAPAPVPQAQPAVPSTNVYIPEKHSPGAPQAGLAPYAPTAQSYATPTTAKPLPVEPYVAPRAAAPAAAPTAMAPAPTPIPAPTYVPTLAPAAGAASVVPAPAPVATSTTTPRMISTTANPIPSAATDTIPEPRAPERDYFVRGTSPETGNPSAPIAPSTFKEQKLAPMPGQTSQVNPEDPGATPQNLVLQPPVPRGPDDTAPSFATKTIKPSDFN